MDTEALIGELAGSLLRQIDDIAEEMVRRILSDESSYRGGEVVPLADLRRSVRDNAAMVIATVAAPADDPERFDPPRATGRRRAEQGLPLEGLLHAYRIGGRLIWERMVSEATARHPDHLGLLLTGATHVWDAIDAFSMVVAEAYRRRESDLSRRSAERSAILADALLEGQGDTPAVARDAEAALGGWAPNGLAVVVAVREGERAALADPARALRERGMSSVWSPRARGFTGVVALASQTVLEVRDVLTAAAHGRIGVSPAEPLLERVPAAARLAEAAAATVVESSGVALLDEQAPAALLARSPDIARRLVATTLGPILALPLAEQEILLETLQVYLGHGGSSARAAEALYCHPNTLGNRLRRIVELTGANPRDPRDQARLNLAMSAQRLHTATGRGGS